MMRTGFKLPRPGLPGRVFSLLLLCGSLSVGWAGSFEDFFVALRQDNVSQLQDLLRRGFDPNTRDETNLPPLLIALKAEAFQTADFLARQKGMDLDATNAADENALMLAALKGQTGLVKTLLEHGAQVNKPGWAPLHYAATFAGSAGADMVAWLLEENAYIDAESPNGSTPLMMAARYGDRRAVTVLLEAGADATLRNQQGLSAIQFAQAAGRTDVAESIAKAIRDKAPKGAW